MTVKECYEKLEGDYSGTMSRMMKEDRMKKFLLLFLQDTSYQMLCENMDKGDVDEAFRAAHTLKGVTINLGLSKLNRASFEITEALRAKELERAKVFLPEVTQCYEETIEAIKGLQEEYQGKMRLYGREILCSENRQNTRHLYELGGLQENGGRISESRIQKF